MPSDPIFLKYFGIKIRGYNNVIPTGIKARLLYITQYKSEASLKFFPLGRIDGNRNVFLKIITKKFPS